MTRSIRPSSRAPEPAPAGRPSLPPTQPFSWKAWLFLALLLGGMAVWQSMNQEQGYPGSKWLDAEITIAPSTVIGKYFKTGVKKNKTNIITTAATIEVN